MNIFGCRNMIIIIIIIIIIIMKIALVQKSKANMLLCTKNFTS